MSNGMRFALRTLGFFILFAGIAGVVLLFVPGPSDIADWMGKSCSHSSTTHNEQCGALDVVLILIGAPMLILVGGVMALSLRPEGKGPFTLDFSGKG